MTGIWSFKHVGAWPAIVWLPLLAGCGPDVRVQSVRADQLFVKRLANALTADDLSPRSAQLLRRYDLEDDYAKDPIPVLNELDQRVRKEPNAETVFTLAELSYLTGKKLERRDKNAALSLYFATVGYAYYYLFDPSVDTQSTEFDPRFRLACDLYNRSLANCIRLAQKQEIRFEDKVRVDLVNGAVDIDIKRIGLLWSPQEFGELRFATDYEVDGLSNSYQTYGLGVPLIVVRKSPDTPSAQDKYFPPATSFPVTAFLRMDSALSESPRKERKATLELIDPLRVQTVEVAGRTVPLESDLTTPLGYFLSNAKLSRLGFVGLLRPDRFIDQSGLYMPQPYEPGKIPVVMVHGLWSSPLTWMQMFNDLRGEPALRDKYQFWFFIYPTGIPVPYSASLLRTALNDARQALDPNHSDEALDQMVLVGHSMGGLLSKMMVQDSESELWNIVSVKPVENLDATTEERQKIKQVFFFEPQLYVRRVVFVGTPHRGSKLSRNTIGRLSSALIELPSKLLDAQQALINRNPDAFTPIFQQLPTSVDNLSPDSPVIQAVAKLPINREVKYHSIIGSISDGDPSESTDGVVPYSSSHLEGAESEYVVAASHSRCQTHPLSVLEVRRILLEHLRWVEDGKPIKPAIIRDGTADVPTVTPIQLVE